MTNTVTIRPGTIPTRPATPTITIAITDHLRIVEDRIKVLAAGAIRARISARRVVTNMSILACFPG